MKYLSKVKEYSLIVMVTGLFQVFGLVLFVIGLIFLLRASGLVNRSSPFFKYRLIIGFPLLIAGGSILILSLIL